MREYVNPIDNIIKELRLKKYRIIKAYNSGMFSDKETCKHNIEVLNAGLRAMNYVRNKYLMKKERN